ncbi:helix-hairpin-helix domain-containing protein [Diaminobutyricibacter tongyongensis]|uniref:Helix-hairpin-helix domain-containing protein n=1 Tax=Leifsonia tongyongensis TaxID=1268043 RepID=A0A6L9XYI4_9MICO|nr:helix-hairpin-helix domain-containing protein [Diaminobutyricibacter tongyongensis]
MSSLAAEAREGSRGARIRIGVGAGVVLLLVALVVAVVVTTLAPRGGVRELDAGRGMTTPPATNARDGAPSGTGAGTAAPVLLVHVLGAVVRPGIVELRPGARVVDAIAAAGGLAADANPGGVNLARSVADGEQLVVPREGEVIAPQAPTAGGVTGGAPGGALVNLNLASAAELQALPRIGPALAQRIVDWREAHGLFASPADLMKVSGIGQTLFDALKDLVTV